MKKHPELRLSLTGRKGFLLLALLLAALLIGGTAWAADGDDIPLTLDQEKKATISSDVWFTYTPNQTGNYLFSSFGNAETNCNFILYQRDGEEYIVEETDITQLNGNFRVTCRLEAGTEYKFSVAYAEAAAGSFRVLISRNRFIADNGALLWSLSGSNALTVSGSEAMPEYIGGDTPWFDYADQITSIVLKNGVPNIGPYAFTEYPALTSVTVPASVTDIGEYAFFGCSSLSKITISSGLTDVGNYAFADCTSLTTVALPDTVTTIYDGTFSGCVNLNSLTVPETVHFKGPSVLEGCDKLANSNGYIVLGSLLAGYIREGVANPADVPSTVHVIGDYAFYGNTQLNSIVLPDGVTAIGDFAFAFCENLSEISIPAGLSDISPSAFTGCTKLNTGDSEDFLILGTILYRYTGSASSVTIPDGVTEIGISAFDGNKDITSVTFPSSLTEIASYAFRGCSSLKKIIGPSGSSTVTHYHYNRYDGLYAIELPSSVQTCGENSFTGTALGQSIQPNFVIPENYNSELVIEEEAFSGIAAYYVFVPASVSRISSGTFVGCTELRFIYFSNPDCIIADDAFSGCGSSLTFICQEEGGASSVHSFADAHHFLFIEDAEEEIDE